MNIFHEFRKTDSPTHESLDHEHIHLPAGTIVPKEMLFTSSSGVDPDITPEAARFQVQRIATARGIGVPAVMKVVEQCTAGPQYGIFGEPRVNVMKPNCALDAMDR